MNPKTAVILVLVLIALLFAGGVTAGTMEAPSDPDPNEGPPPFAERLGKLFGLKQPAGDSVDLAKVKADGVLVPDNHRVRLTANKPCQLFVPEAGSDGICNLVVKIEGATVTITATVGGKKAEEDYEAGKQTTIPVRRAAVTLTLMALGQNAVVTLE